jgi:hypothetical protein
MTSTLFVSATVVLVARDGAPEYLRAQEGELIHGVDIECYADRQTSDCGHLDEANISLQAMQSRARR